METGPFLRIVTLSLKTGNLTQVTRITITTIYHKFTSNKRNTISYRRQKHRKHNKNTSGRGIKPVKEKEALLVPGSML